MAICRNHPDRTAAGRCTGCAEEYCWPCMVELHGHKYCGSCKMMALDGKVPAAVAGAREAWAKPVPQVNQAFSTGLVAFFGGALGCFFVIGLICGIVAITNGIAAKKVLAQFPSRMGSFKTTVGIVFGSMGILFNIGHLLLKAMALGHQ